MGSEDVYKRQVWISIFLFEKQMVPDGVFNEISSDLPRAGIVFICGCVYAIGMQIHLSAASRVGLILSSSITSTGSVLCGVILSAFLGGVPAGASIVMILFSAVLLIAGTIVCQVAGKMRDDDKKIAQSTNKAKARVRDILLLVLVAVVLQPFFSIASSVGLKTDLRPNGFSAFTCMGILCLGAFVGTAIFSLIMITKDHLWDKVFHPTVKMSMIIGMAIISAFCHFGGNLLHAVASPVVSVVIATGIGYSNGIWSYLWGMIYGEFSGSRKKTLFVLGSGMALYIAGVVILTFNIS